MEKPLDLRIQKTHTALINAFLQLLQTKRFENITINELCELAMVRRATFYKHFADKYEFFTFFVQWIQREFRNRIVPQEYDRNGVSPYIDIIRFALDFLDENETIVHSVMESNAFPLLLDLISEQIILDVKERLQTDQNNGKELLLSPELMAFSYTGALLNILRWWIGHKDQMSKEEIVAQIQKVFDKLYAA
ncbi:MAG: TetR/AcrR family transcriptional regulator [Peptococcaceae bacterium]|nr:TetR/AcrR family transcriptional regulator [Peptococcaceae bacterium]